MAFKQQQERIFENTYSSKRQEHENTFHEGNDEHVHDNKALSELVENVIESDSVTAICKLLSDDGDYEGNIIFRYRR